MTMNKAAHIKSRSAVVHTMLQTLCSSFCAMHSCKIQRSNNQNKARFSSEILVSTQIYVSAYHAYVHYPSIYVYSVLLFGSILSSLISSRT